MVNLSMGERNVSKSVRPLDDPLEYRNWPTLRRIAFMLEHDASELLKLVDKNQLPQTVATQLENIAATIDGHVEDLKGYKVRCAECDWLMEPIQDQRQLCPVCAVKAESSATDQP